MEVEEPGGARAWARDWASSDEEDDDVDEEEDRDEPEAPVEPGARDSTTFGRHD